MNLYAPLLIINHCYPLIENSAKMNSLTICVIRNTRYDLYVSFETQVMIYNVHFSNCKVLFIHKCNVIIPRRHKLHN